MVVLLLLTCINLAAVAEEKCNPPKFIPDADNAPLIYYSADSRQCDKVCFAQNLGLPSSVRFFKRSVLFDAMYVGGKDG